MSDFTRDFMGVDTFAFLVMTAVFAMAGLTFAVPMSLEQRAILGCLLYVGGVAIISVVELVARKAR